MSGPPDELATEGCRWLRFATEDLRLAERDLGDPEVVPRGACLHAQQAAEKAIKAALILLAIEPPTIHNLDALRRRLPDGWEARNRPSDLARLSGRARSRGPRGCPPRLGARCAPPERVSMTYRKKLIEIALPLEAIT